MKIKYSIYIMMVVQLFMVGCQRDDDSSGNDLSNNNDRLLFHQINQANSKSNDFWAGYEFSSYPKYFIYKESDAALPKKAFVVNPPSSFNEVTGATKIDYIGGLDIYRYDRFMNSANDSINQGNGLFSFDFAINNFHYFIQRYKDEEIDFRIKDINTIAVAFHEVFHNFQWDNWTLPNGFIQDFDNYPINNDLLPLQILTSEVAKQFPLETDIDQIDKYLSIYVAIRSKEMELDPTPNSLVKNMANFQESFEGSAKYVEFELGQSIFLENYPSSYSDLNTQAILEGDEMRFYFASGIWYDTGSAVCYMLKQKGINIEELIKNGKTLYDIASESLNLTDSQKDDFLLMAKNEFLWDTLIIPEATRLLSL